VHPEHAAAVVCLQVAQLKWWVTDNKLEDEKFFKLCQDSKAKKTDWVRYTKEKLASC
jgi:hypothetical protein